MPYRKADAGFLLNRQIENEVAILCGLKPRSQAPPYSTSVEVARALLPSYPAPRTSAAPAVWPVESRNALTLHNPPAVTAIAHSLNKTASGRVLSLSPIGGDRIK